MRPLLKTRRAFTLIEAVVALVIIGVSLPPMLLAIRSFHARRADVTTSSRARWLAAEKLEDIIADRHSATRGYAYVLNANYPAEAAVTGFARYSRSTSISEVAADLSTPASGSGRKLVTVTVGYTDQGGSARSLTISTVLTQYTP